MAQEATELWHQALQVLSKSMSGERLRTWILPLKPLSLTQGKLTLSAPNEFLREGLETHYVPRLHQALTEAAGREISVALELAPNLLYPAPEQLDVDESPPELNPDFTFEGFVVGPSNRLAHAAALAVAESPARVYNPLFIYGDEGLGKTHLLQAVSHQLRSRGETRSAAYLPCESFIGDYIAALEAGNLGKFRRRHRSFGALLLDDVHVLATRPQSQEELFHVFNYLYESGCQIVLSSIHAPQAIPSVEQRLLSRFNWGLVARIDPPAFETRAAIIGKKLTSRGIKLDDDVVDAIAEVPCRGVRELEAILARVLAYASLANRPLARDLLPEALGQTASIRKYPSIEDILKVVTAEFPVSIPDLLSKRRLKSLVIPRQICMYLARRLTKHSLEQIGGYFGGRDHTTVLHALAQVKDRAKRDPRLGELLLRMEAQL